MSKPSPMEPEFADGAQKLRGNHASVRLCITSAHDPELVHPYASLSLDKEGGLIVAPAEVAPGSGWGWGIYTPDGQGKEWRATEHRPKITCHRRAGRFPHRSRHRGSNVSPCSFLRSTHRVDTASSSAQCYHCNSVNLLPAANVT